MTIKEILISESRNEGYVYLYLEGIFWKAYEKSAYFFVRDMKPFKVIRHFVKAASQDIVYIGFPKQTLSCYVFRFNRNLLKNGKIVFLLLMLMIGRLKLHLPGNP